MSRTPPPRAQRRQVSSDAHRRDAKELLELLRRQQGVALAPNVVDAGPVAGKPDFSSNGRAVGGEDESVGSVSAEPPEDFIKPYRAVLIEDPCGAEKLID